jgi:nitrilase
MAEIDRGQIIRGKYDLDVVGHYARPDIFQLHVDEQPKRPVTTHSSDPKKPALRTGRRAVPSPVE